MSWKDIILENDHMDYDEEPDYIFEGIEPAIAFAYRKAADYMNNHGVDSLIINECDVSFRLENTKFPEIRNSTSKFSITMSSPECIWNNILRIEMTANYDKSDYAKNPIRPDHIYAHDNNFTTNHNTVIALNDLLIKENFCGIETGTELLRFSHISELESYLQKMEKDPMHDFKYHFVRSSLQFLPEYLVESLQEKGGLN